MARVKSAMTTRARHKKVLKQAKGYYGAKHYRFRNANQAVLKSLSYAYVGRKDKKSDFRKLWIARINAAARMNGTTYSKLIAGLKKANVTVNRKMLSEIPTVFRGSSLPSSRRIFRTRQTAIRATSVAGNICLSMWRWYLTVFSRTMHSAKSAHCSGSMKSRGFWRKQSIRRKRQKLKKS